MFRMKSAVNFNRTFLYINLKNIINGQEPVLPLHSILQLDGQVISQGFCLLRIMHRFTHLHPIVQLILQSLHLILLVQVLRHNLLQEYPRKGYLYLFVC